MDMDMPLEEIPRNKIVGSKDKYICNFDRYYQIALHRGLSFCTPASNVWECLSPQSCQQSMLSNFGIFANLLGEKLYLSVVSNFIYLIIGDIYHFFICVRPFPLSAGNSYSWFLRLYTVTLFRPCFSWKPKYFLLVLEGPSGRAGLYPKYPSF